MRPRPPTVFDREEEEHAAADERALHRIALSQLPPSTTFLPFDDPVCRPLGLSGAGLFLSVQEALTRLLKEELTASTAHTEARITPMICVLSAAIKMCSSKVAAWGFVFAKMGPLLLEVLSFGQRAIVLRASELLHRLVEHAPASLPQELQTDLLMRVVRYWADGDPRIQRGLLQPILRMCQRSPDLTVRHRSNRSHRVIETRAHDLVTIQDMQQKGTSPVC